MEKTDRYDWWPRWVWVGECFFWYRLTWVVPDKFHRAIKRLWVVCVNTTSDHDIMTVNQGFLNYTSSLAISQATRTYKIKTLPFNILLSSTPASLFLSSVFCCRAGSGYPNGYPVLGNNRGGFPCLPRGLWSHIVIRVFLLLGIVCLRHPPTPVLPSCALSRAFPYPQPGDAGGCRSAPAACQSLTSADPTCDVRFIKEDLIQCCLKPFNTNNSWNTACCHHESESAHGLWFQLYGLVMGSQLEFVNIYWLLFHTWVLVCICHLCWYLYVSALWYN